MTAHWITNSRSILDSALSLLTSTTDNDVRQAFVLHDQAVEVMAWDYLRMNDASFSGLKKSPNFNVLIEALSTRHAARLGSVDPSKLKWFHNVRNTLYHSPDALSVNRQHLADFSELVQRLHRNLFYGQDLSVVERQDFDAFDANWKTLISAVDRYTTEHSPRSSHGFSSEQVLVAWFGDEYCSLKSFRERVLGHQLIHSPQQVHEHRVRMRRLLERLHSSPAGSGGG